MSGYRALEIDAFPTVAPGLVFRCVKRALDIATCFLLLPVLALTGLMLCIINPFANSGPLVFRQRRMGKDCIPFVALKFRTMRAHNGKMRGADAPLERERITPLGQFLRETRLDELPQILNVLRGEMSLIGPRPDFLDHAEHYLTIIPGYRERHSVRPGISGYAQTEMGYAEGIEATRQKVHADLFYIAHSSLRFDGWIFLRTIWVVLTKAGS